LLGLQVRDRLGDPPHYVDCSSVVSGDAAGAYLGFEHVAEPAPRSRVHLDIEPDDIEETTSWIVANGGSRAPAGDVSEHGESWRVMRDPEGNEFCLWFA
jgi:predicted enzyme related to lactoylglutathione lyase